MVTTKTALMILVLTHKVKRPLGKPWFTQDIVELYPKEMVCEDVIQGWDFVNTVMNHGVTLREECLNQLGVSCWRKSWCWL